MTKPKTSTHPLPLGWPRLPPEVLEAVGRELGVAHRVLDVLVTEPRLQGPRVVAVIGQLKAAAMPQHVRMHRERHLRPFADATEITAHCRQIGEGTRQ